MISSSRGDTRLTSGYTLTPCCWHANYFDPAGVPGDLLNAPRWSCFIGQTMNLVEEMRLPDCFGESYLIKEILELMDIATNYLLMFCYSWLELFTRNFFFIFQATPKTSA